MRRRLNERMCAEKCADLRKAQRLPTKVYGGRVKAKVAGSIARWFEGCDRHSEMWTAQYTLRKRKYEGFKKRVPGHKSH